MGESVPQQFVPMLIEHWRNGRFPVDRIITTYPFHDLDKAVDDMRNHEIIKPVLTTPVLSCPNPQFGRPLAANVRHRASLLTGVHLIRQPPSTTRTWPFT
jgi:hypothetical protein